VNTERLQALGKAAKKLRTDTGSETPEYKAAIDAIDEEAKFLRNANPSKFWQLSDPVYQAMCSDWARGRELRSLFKH